MRRRAAAKQAGGLVAPSKLPSRIHKLCAYLYIVMMIKAVAGQNAMMSVAWEG
jgi:hypothetical protein